MGAICRIASYASCSGELLNMTLGKSFILLFRSTISLIAAHKSSGRGRARQGVIVWYGPGVRCTRTCREPRLTPRDGTRTVLYHFSGGCAGASGRGGKQVFQCSILRGTHPHNYSATGCALPNAKPWSWGSTLTLQRCYTVTLFDTRVHISLDPVASTCT